MTRFRPGMPAVAPPPPASRAIKGSHPERRWAAASRSGSRRSASALAAVMMAPLVLGSVPLAAQAQSVTLNNNPTVTAVSGYAGGSVTLGASSGLRGLTAIEWYEDSDEPCKLILDTKDFNTQDINRPQVLLEDVYTHAGKQPCSSPGNKKDVRLAGSDNWIYKIQACTTDKRDTSDNKLKGIRIWPATVNSRSPLAVSRGSSAVEDKHTHCDKWHATASCPVGKIASRLLVHHDASKTKIMGLALECRTLATN
jgi:hypothetical protein